MHNVIPPRIPMLAALWVCAGLVRADESPQQPDLIQATVSLGGGNQYKYVPPGGKFPGPPIKITELTKINKVYIYEQKAESEWQLRGVTPGGEIAIDLFKGHSLRATRLVDVKVTNHSAEVLLSHSQGYYYYIFEKNGEQWKTKAWAEIFQVQFLMKGEVDPTVNYVQIEDGQRVAIKRTGMADAIYIMNVGEPEIVGTGHGDNRAIYRYKANG